MYIEIWQKKSTRKNVFQKKFACTVSEGGLLEPQPANVTWFRAKDMDSSGWLSLNELTYYHQLPNWFNFRYAEAMDRLIKEADLNR